MIGRAAEFARRVWEEIDRQDRVAQVLVLLAVPDAQYKTYAMADPGNSLQMGGVLGGRGQLLTAPEEPLTVRRRDLGHPDTIDRLRAELKRRFAAEQGPQYL
ncbi:hypothetical protein [Patulibacter sp. SYSU D01012]|uniref:hypothetical protein n=1 Tax=Patulibacter sp. SYSU D01012 TaxID=2817381 RepID=UPI001B300819|nr:hypothetical protein [Patulibacter sp. SYSU D01012]